MVKKKKRGFYPELEPLIWVHSVLDVERFIVCHYNGHRLLFGRSKIDEISNKTLLVMFMMVIGLYTLFQSWVSVFNVSIKYRCID